jgi:uncharacterized protein (DUF1015 family)
MRIEPFRLISFDSAKWESSSELAQSLLNTDTKDKLRRTKDILALLKGKIAMGEAKMDSEPAIYALNINDGMKSSTSIIAAVHYDEKKIFFPNEDTHPDKIKGYRRVFDTYKLQINPVLTFYKDGPTIKSLVENTVNFRPKVQASINGALYTLWQIKNPLEIENIKNSVREINKLYIADGHHRFSIFQGMQNKTSLRIMVSLTDARSICLKSCHRVVVGKIPKDWIQKISKYCIMEVLDGNDISLENCILIKFRDGYTYKVIFRSDVIDKISLYSAVDNIIFKEALGIHESDREGKIFPLPGDITFDDCNNIFSLYSGSSMIVFIPDICISEFFKIVDNGNKLPPTSTWFEPKIIDGFLMSHFG